MPHTGSRTSSTVCSSIIDAPAPDRAALDRSPIQRLLHILLGVRIELPLASGSAEVIGLSLVVALARCFLRVNVHSTNNILHHLSVLLGFGCTTTHGYISFTHKDARRHIPLHSPFDGTIEAFVVRAATANLNESLGSRSTRAVQPYRDIVRRRMLCLG